MSRETSATAHHWPDRTHRFTPYKRINKKRNKQTKNDNNNS